MKIFISILITILLLTGCSYESNDIDGKHSELKTYCDKKYGIEYIRDTRHYNGGITARFDENGNVIHCK